MAEAQEFHKERYLAYLLRLWQESESAPGLWRASLERPQGGERLGFASLVDLFVFLENETRSGSGDRRPSDTGGSRTPGPKA